MRDLFMNESQDCHASSYMVFKTPLPYLLQLRAHILSFSITQKFTMVSAYSADWKSGGSMIPNLTPLDRQTSLYFCFANPTFWSSCSTPSYVPLLLVAFRKGSIDLLRTKNLPVFIFKMDSKVSIGNHAWIKSSYDCVTSIHIHSSNKLLLFSSSYEPSAFLSVSCSYTILNTLSCKLFIQLRIQYVSIIIL